MVDLIKRNNKDLFTSENPMKINTNDIISVNLRNMSYKLFKDISNL